MNIKMAIVLLGVWMGFITTAAADPLVIGDQAPDFVLPDSSGQQVALSDFRGKYVVLYFYPKDNSPYCTTEACAFRDQQKDFHERNAAIIGISRDSVQSHAGFSEKYGLPFVLLADATGQTVKAYDAQSGFFMNLIGLATARKTYLIDPQGRIVKKYPNVNVDRHAQEILEDLRAVQAEAATNHMDHGNEPMAGE